MCSYNPGVAVAYLATPSERRFAAASAGARIPAGAADHPGTRTAGSLGTRVVPATRLLTDVLPYGGLQRGTTTIVSPGAPGVAGATTFALELLAGVSLAGHWCAAVGLANLGVLAAAERGISLDRLLLVPSPGGPGRWQQVLATLSDGVEAVLFCPPAPVRPADARKLSARTKERRSILIVLDRHARWSEPVDLRCQVRASSWNGLGDGHGLLSNRSMEIEVSGRGAAARPRRAAVTLSRMGRIA